MTEWEPATEAEVAMRDALREGDQEQYFRILSRAELLLPVSADALAGRTPMGWGTWTTSGRTHVLAFTSSVALRACLADNAGSARRIAFHDLAAAWPHLEWWLAVNPGLPVEGYLPAWFVAQLARGDVRLPGRAASNRPREHAEAGARARATVTVPGTPLPPQAGVSMPTAAPPNVPAPAAPPPGVPAAAAPYASAPAGDASYTHAQTASSAPHPVHPSPTSPIGAPGSAPGPIPAQMAAGESVPGLAPPAAASASASTVAPTPTASGLPRRVPAPPPPPGVPPPSMAPRPPMPSPTPGPSPIPPQNGPIPPQVSAAPPQTGPMSPQVSAVPSQAGPVMAAGPAASSTFAPDPVQSSSGVLAGEIVSDWGPPVVPGRPVAPAASAPPVPAPFAPPAPPPAYAPEAHVPQAHMPQAHVPPPAPVRVPQTNVPPPVPAASARPSAHPASSAAATDFVPANEVEKNLLAAAGDGSTDSFLSTLLLATVLVPVSPVSADGTRPGEPGFAWLTETLDGEPFIVVFTSVERLRDHLGETIETIDVKFTQLIKAWPDPGWSFAVNPSTPVGAKLPGAQIIALASWADEVGLSANTDDEPGPAAVVPHDSDHLTVMQKTLPPNQVAYYLERGYDRVSGFVHRAAEMAHLTSPAALYAALGTAPAGATHNETYVLRWPAHRPTLYRIPYGGPDEPAMRAMEGWVIERPPFRGNGFAPGESGGVIAEFKVDSVRLPHGAQLWRIGADGTEKLIALLDTDAPTWRRVGEH